MESSIRILMLDFGHPMSKTTMKLIKISLQNVMALASVLTESLGASCFGIALMNSDFNLIQTSAYLRKNYDVICQKLDALDKMVTNNEKMTIQEYKNLLIAAIKNILEKFEQKPVKSNQTLKESIGGNKEQSIQITIITKKTGSFLSEMLTKVLEKNLTSVKKLIIIQILKGEEGRIPAKLQKSSTLIDWITCAQDVHEIDYIFKNWLLRLEFEEEQLRLVLSKDINLIIKCDTDDSLINPGSLPLAQKYGLYNNFRAKEFEFVSPPVIKTPAKDLEILYRVSVSGVCPTIVFGYPKRIYPTNSFVLSWNESCINFQIFNELCKELLETQQGLLTKSVTRFQNNDVNSYYFITSDGKTLLLNSVVPDELYLPRRLEFSKFHMDIDEDASLVVKTSLRQINFLEEYSPSDFPSGLYDTFKSYLMRTGKSKVNQLRHRNFEGKLPVSKRWSSIKQLRGSKRTASRPTYSATSICKSSITSDSKEGGSQSEGKRKYNNELENTNIHPALLDPSAIAKYRKVYPSAFNLPELSQAYMEN